MTETPGIHPTEKNILLSPDLALSDFLGVWQDDMLADSIAWRLTCTEVDVLADLLAANGYPRTANDWLLCHVQNDHEYDDQVHYLFKEDE